MSSSEAGGTRRTLIGWHGTSARVPEEWTLGALGGDRKSGYLRVDDERMPRLQVKWARGRIDLERKRKEYVKKLARGKKRRRVKGLDVTTDLRVLSKRSKPGKDIVGYGWRGSQCGMGVLWNCETCNRSVIAQVSWPPDEEGYDLAKEVLESLEDHGTGGWDVWGVDGLAFLAPEDYQLASWKRMTRYLEVNLGKGKATLKVARWGMVPMVLGDNSVAEWYAALNARRRDVRCDSAEERVKGHEGIRAWGRRRGLVAGSKRAVAGVVRRELTDRFEAYAWRCPESNRLYLVENMYRKGGAVAKGVVDSIPCHEED